ncbi:MAG: heavy metal translocating P-type ATPase [Propioniciclava sp.]
MFRRLFWIMLVMAVPTVGFDAKFAELLGYQVPDGWWSWISPVLGTVMYVWGGRPFLMGAVGEFRQRKPGMMMLISLGISVAFVASWLSRLGILAASLEFWWELALLVVIMLLGHWLEMASLADTTSAVDSLAALLPLEAERVTDTGTEKVAPTDLRVGDVVRVRPGGSVPADGSIIEGSASMDESMVTGESTPVVRGTGDPVVAGTVATDSNLQLEITATGDDTTLAGIQRLVAEAQSSTTPTQRLADCAAGWLFWFALTAATLTFVVWNLLGQPEDALTRTITVLVIACPHALGLAIPLVVSIATERAARSGVLITDRIALETMRDVGSVLMDKTGTLTTGQPQVIGVAGVPGTDEDSVVALAAAAESASEHPLAQAIVALAGERDVAVAAATEISSRPAVGVRATVGGQTIEVGGPALLTEHGAEPLADTQPGSAAGSIVLHVLADGAPIGALRLADAIRPESADAVNALQALGGTVVMITGDAEPVAQHVAGELGITRVFAHVRPEDKSARVSTVQAEGGQVAMVGDGVNDAPALAQADVGLAIGAGTDVAIASADVVLASDDPRSVVSLIQLSQRTYRLMVQNLWWAAGYNLISVPLAAGVLAPVGFVLPMSIGALLMSASTIIVALNAQRLRRLDMNPAASVEWALTRI